MSAEALSTEALSVGAPPLHTPGRHPLITEAIEDDKVLSSFETIGDPPDDKLYKRSELSMVIPIDEELEQVLLQIPNDLGWKYHFGLLGTQTPREALSHALLCNEGQLVVRPAGLMLFSFRGRGTTIKATGAADVASTLTPPMRVRVYTSNTPFDPHGGESFHYDEVPYDDMWADDIIWMPTLLKQSETTYFEGHFVFDGPPGTGTKLLTHNYKVYDRSKVGFS